MKKVLLIEDRFRRQALFSKETNIDLEEYSDILDNFTDGKERNLFELTLKEDFNYTDYDYIICHKSIFNGNNNQFLTLLKKYTQENNIPLILFSGGVSVNYYTNTPHELLELNSKTFYSQNLKLFLEALKSGDENILMLCYGKNWQLDILSHILEKVNLFINDIDKKKIVYNEFANEMEIVKLKTINHTFHDIVVENGWITVEEVLKFRDSIFDYFKTKDTLCTVAEQKQKTLLIHNFNVDLDLFDTQIIFDREDKEIDEYISKDIIKELNEDEYDIVFIKDNLSSNYLEFYGLTIAYHIRLSAKLSKTKRYLPIVIISDFDSEILNKLTSLAKILFTQSIFIIKNDKKEINAFSSKNFKPLTVDEYKMNFLNLIIVDPPKDYTDHHDITNEWAIYQWSNALELTTDAIDINHNKISSMLYFKYLKSLHEMSDDSEEKYEVISSTKKGKILYIDDEWAKGWSDILNALFEQSSGIDFKTFEYSYKDTNKFTMLKDIKQAIEKEKPDVVILDLRLSQTDHTQVEDIEQYTGIKVLKIIKEINPGIQVIMMTATRQSVILEKLYDYGVLGYIKKEHPNDVSVYTVENIGKLFKLAESGLGRKYLKDIFVTKSKIEYILENDIFVQYISDEEKYEPFWIQLQVETTQVFDILSNSDSKNKFKYAMVSIASSLEAILSIFITEVRNSDNKYWDGEICSVNTLNTKLNDLFYEKFGYPDKSAGHRSELRMGGMITKRNDYLHSRKKVEVSKDEMKSWFNKLLKMIEIIKSPPNLRRYDTGNMVQNLNDAFNNR